MPDPAVMPGHVLIRVHAVSLNHIDLFLREGLPGIKVPLPHIPGCDAAGEIEAIGDGVSGLAIGDRVLLNPNYSCGHCEFCLRGDASMCVDWHLVGETIPGTSSELFLARAENVAPIPQGMSYTDAASIPLVFMTAWRMLMKRGRLRAGEDVLILGASAGVGIACIQIAKAAGARVIAAASTGSKLDLCEALGADELINYRETPFPKSIRELTGRRGVDVVVDYVGKDTWVDSLKSLRHGGRVLTCGATSGFDPVTDLRRVFFRQLEIIGSTMGDANDLRDCLKLIDAGKMRPVVSQVYPLEDIAAAHSAMARRETLGKVVLSL